MIELLIIVILVAILVVGVRGLLEGKREPQELLDNVGKKSTATLAQVNEQFQGIRDRFSGKKQVNLAQKFRVWVTEQLGQRQDLQQWLLALSDEAFEILSSQLAIFCDELNIDLVWLVEKRLDRRPLLKAKVEQVVITYCSSCWQAVQIQKELQSFKILDTILTNPTDKQQQSVSQKLYIEFINQGLVPKPEPDMHFASETERWKHVGEAIQEVATKDSAKFDAVFNQIMAQNQ
jgi:hypothetical protein